MAPLLVYWEEQGKKKGNLISFLRPGWVTQAGIFVDVSIPE